MYKYSDKNENNDISLHDCRANHIELNGKILSFIFNDGIYIGENNKQNPYGKLSYTDKAEVRFDLTYKNPDDNITIYVFTEKDEKTIRETIGLHDLIDKINSGMELEFLNCYNGNGSVLFKCWLWFKEEPYHKECVLIISADEITYYWNHMYEECTDTW